MIEGLFWVWNFRFRFFFFGGGGGGGKENLVWGLIWGSFGGYSWFATHSLDWIKNTLLLIYSTNILVPLLTLNMKNCLTPENPKMGGPILVILLKMRPHYSQPSRENVTPSSGTSPLASYQRKYTSVGFSFLAPDWLFSCKTITFLRCFKCSRFSQSQCKFPDKREMLLFVTTNMAAVMSRAMQQFENNLKIRGSAWKFGMGFLGG